jgi:hypothetical protein
MSEEDVPRKQGDEDDDGRFNVEEAFQSQDFADLCGISMK